MSDNAAIARLVRSMEDMEHIKQLQEGNLRHNLTPEERATEGFVTNTYTLDFFSKMHNACPSIVAVDPSKGDLVVGYALAITKEIAFHHEFMDIFKNHLDQQKYNGRALGQCNYLMMGQVCVAKSHRGRGVFALMFAEYKKQYSSVYEYLITDISEHNPRSLRAHLKVGFEILEKRVADSEVWLTVIWDWRRI